MASPRSKEARLFFRCAYQRLDEAQFLLKHQMYTAAVYLGGYGVECMLKALILESVETKNRADAQKKFRGRIAHDFDWLRGMYRDVGGAEPPKEIIKQLVIVSGWSTDLRYEPRQLAAPDALAFMKAVEAIIHWADGRL